MGDRVKNVEDYLKEVYGKKVSVTHIAPLGGDEAGDDIKGFGYGKPYLIEFRVNGEEKSAVLSSMRVQEGFGHDNFADRAGIILWENRAYNTLPQHVRSIDAGYFTKGSGLKSTGDADEFFILMERVSGSEYFRDLNRIRDNDMFGQMDIDRAKALSDYLVSIHSIKHESPVLYKRRIRELVGLGECIMGLSDSYPDGFKFYSRKDFKRMEKKCVEWRWNISDKAERLCVVHGDFHPWNIMFRNGIDFTVLDRSRGEYGEAADDVACMSMNYIFYSLQKYGRLKKDFKKLFDVFINNYLERTGDKELMSIIQPFYAFRALVVASPIWYPGLAPEVRISLFNFIDNVLSCEKFDHTDVNQYFKRG